jgi:hypothetical protein
MLKDHYGTRCTLGALDVFVFEAASPKNKRAIASLRLSLYDGIAAVQKLVPFAVAPVKSARTLAQCLEEQLDTVLFYHPKTFELHACEEGTVYRFDPRRDPPRGKARIIDLAFGAASRAEKKAPAPAENVDFMLFKAAGDGNLARVNRAIEKGASVNPARKRFTTPLHVAAKQGHVEIVKRLLALGANPSAKDEYGYTPAWHAQSMVKHLGKLKKDSTRFEKSLALLVRKRPARSSAIRSR